jgi:hypothetical protein
MQRNGGPARLTSVVKIDKPARTPLDRADLAIVIGTVVFVMIAAGLAIWMLRGTNG